MTLRILGRQPHFLSHPQGGECLKKDRAVTYVEMFLRGEGGNKGLSCICDLATGGYGDFEQLAGAGEVETVSINDYL